MNERRAAWAGALLVALPWATGCAVGEAGVDADELTPEMPDAGAEAAAPEAGSMPQDGGQVLAPARDARSDSPSVVDGGGMGADGSAGDDGGTQPDAGSEPMVSCEATSGCNAARYLGDLSGDEGSASNRLETTGTRSEWLSFRLREDSNFSRGLSTTLTLSSSGDADYDLFVHIPGSADGMACSNPQHSSTNMGAQPEEVSLSIDDKFGSDDSRTISVEVRHVGGDCNPFTLDVRGPS